MQTVLRLVIWFLMMSPLVSTLIAGWFWICLINMPFTAGGNATVKLLWHVEKENSQVLCLSVKTILQIRVVSAFSARVFQISKLYQETLILIFKTCGTEAQMSLFSMGKIPVNPKVSHIGNTAWRVWSLCQNRFFWFLSLERVGNRKTRVSVWPSYDTASRMTSVVAFVSI